MNAISLPRPPARNPDRSLTSCRSVALSLSGNSLGPSGNSRPYVLGISGTTKANPNTGKEITA